MSVVIRRAAPADVAVIARFYRRVAGEEWNFLVAHTADEDRALIRGAVERGPIWLAHDGVQLIGFCAAHRGWIDHLYVANSRRGEGIGRALLQRTLNGRTAVQLWTFQRNTRSRDFYRRQGFVEVRLTDGRDNVEKEPDVLLAWRRRRRGDR